MSQDSKAAEAFR